MHSERRCCCAWVCACGRPLFGGAPDCCRCLRWRQLQRRTGVYQFQIAQPAPNWSRPVNITGRDGTQVVLLHSPGLWYSQAWMARTGPVCCHLLVSSLGSAAAEVHAACTYHTPPLALPCRVLRPFTRPKLSICLCLSGLGLQSVFVSCGVLLCDARRGPICAVHSVFACMRCTHLRGCDAPVSSVNACLSWGPAGRLCLRQLVLVRLYIA